MSKQNSATKLNGHLIGQPVSGNKQTQLNGQATKEQTSNGKTQQQNQNNPTIQQTGKENLTNGLIKSQVNGQNNKDKSLNQLANAQLNNEQQVNGQVNGTVLTNGTSDIELEEVEKIVINKEQESEPMDTSEPPVNPSEENYVIETDQNNNIVMIKCCNKSPISESTDKSTKDINNNVQACKINNNPLTNFNNQPQLMNTPKDDQSDETTKVNQALNITADNKTKLTGKEQQIKKEEKSTVKNVVKVTIKPNSTSLPLQQASSSNTSTTTTTSSNTTQIILNNNNSTSINNSSLNNKTNEISKLRKIAADSVHNAIKFKKVDEQTAITTIANGLKNEKKVLKCANNGNETASNENSVKINLIHLVDQLTKSRNEELSSSPNENDQTLAQTPPQLQTKKTTTTNSSNNGKLKIPWNQKIDSWWHDLMSQVDDVCEPVWLDAEHPLFILYTR